MQTDLKMRENEKPEIKGKENNLFSLNANAFSIDSIISDNNKSKCAKTPETSSKNGEILIKTLDGKRPFNIRSPKLTCAVSTELPPSFSPVNDNLVNLNCILESKDLWRKFHDLGTEMIITKTGRRMFPTIRVSFSGVKLEAKYLVAMDIVPVDYKRYRYAYHKSCWLVAGKADPPLEPRIYFHPESSLSGQQLSKQMCSFEKLKLTNNTIDQSGHVILHSMHKYQPRIHVIAIEENCNVMETITKNDYKTFIFTETQFTAVTAYQNQLITRLKIDSNPFAKGFRDSSRISEFEQETVEGLISEQRVYRPSLTALDLLMSTDKSLIKKAAYDFLDSPSSRSNLVQPFSAPRMFRIPNPYRLSYQYIMASEMKSRNSLSVSNTNERRMELLGARSNYSLESAIWQRQNAINTAALCLASGSGLHASNFYSRYYPYFARSMHASREQISISRETPGGRRFESAITPEDPQNKVASSSPT